MSSTDTDKTQSVTLVPTGAQAPNPPQQMPPSPRPPGTGTGLRERQPMPPRPRPTQARRPTRQVPARQKEDARSRTMQQRDTWAVRIASLAPRLVRSVGHLHAEKREIFTVCTAGDEAVVLSCRTEHVLGCGASARLVHRVPASLTSSSSSLASKVSRQRKPRTASSMRGRTGEATPGRFPRAGRGPRGRGHGPACMPAKEGNEVSD